MKALTLAKKAGEPFYGRRYENVLSRQVPAGALSSTSTSTRRPGKPLDPLRPRVPQVRDLARKARRSSSRTATSRFPAKIVGRGAAQVSNRRRGDPRRAGGHDGPPARCSLGRGGPWRRGLRSERSRRRGRRRTSGRGAGSSAPTGSRARHRRRRDRDHRGGARGSSSSSWPRSLPLLRGATRQPRGALRFADGDRDPILTALADPYGARRGAARDGRRSSVDRRRRAWSARSPPARDGTHASAVGRIGAATISRRLARRPRPPLSARLRVDFGQARAAPPRRARGRTLQVAARGHAGARRGRGSRGRRQAASSASSRGRRPGVALLRDARGGRRARREPSPSGAASTDRSSASASERHGPRRRRARARKPSSAPTRDASCRADRLATPRSRRPSWSSSSRAIRRRSPRLGFLLGGQSLVVRRRNGGGSRLVPDALARRTRPAPATAVHVFEPLPAAVTALAPLAREQGLPHRRRARRRRLRHYDDRADAARAPGERRAAETRRPRSRQERRRSSASGGRRAVDAGRSRTRIPRRRSVALRQVWYEGYDEPEYVWQSTGGTDDFEPKLSLSPLIFGTLKGTLYALLFAIPLALVAALYTRSSRAGAAARREADVEIMAALPSVVLGFLAGLWLAPLVERTPSARCSCCRSCRSSVVAAALGLAGAAARASAAALRPAAGDGAARRRVLVGALARRTGSAGRSSRLVFGGDFQSWLVLHRQLTYDQRNCARRRLRDGLRGHPDHLHDRRGRASRTCRRTCRPRRWRSARRRWQTATRVVLPTASPGIFSAVMVGFGRAVGETMIVLMATGNTPIMDWSIFNGLRTLSANIAVEIPEAPHGGTLYRVLFLAACSLRRDLRGQHRGRDRPPAPAQDGTRSI